MKKNGRSLIEDLSLIKHGMIEFGTFLPGQLRLLFVYSLITMTIPYIGIIMTSEVISELSGKRRIKILLFSVIIALLATFVLSVLSALINKKLTAGYNQLFPAHEIRLNEKANAMKYALLENEEVRALRDEVSGSIDCSGAGMGSLYWDLGSIFAALISGAISIVILAHNIGIKGTTIGFSGSLFGFVNSIWGYFLLILIIVFSALLSSKMTSKIFDVSFDVFKDGAKYNRYANFYKLDYLSNDKSAKDVRIYSQKDLIIRETLDKCYIPFSKGDKREKDASSAGNSILLLMSAITGGMVYVLVGAKGVSGSIGVGNVLLVYAAVTMLIKALADIAMTFTDLRNNNEHLMRYFDYVSMEEEENREKTNEAGFSGKVKIDNVSFKYPGTNNYALHNISLNIKSGEKVAIVGANGSGKTTLVKLICGLYDISEGSITIDDAPLSVVFQDFSLLSLPIGNNISAGAFYDKNKVWDALEKVGMRSRVEKYRNELDQPLFKDYDENGTDLSGGEAQKIAIARGIYKESPIFILDEPTAALDPFAEYEIFTKMNEISEDKTTIFISHRLYSCKFCDRVIVLDNGRIVQEGTHDTLVSVPGKYLEMWNAQAKHYIDN